MTRNIAGRFAPGNTVGRAQLTLTPELATLFVNTVAITGRVSIACERVNVPRRTANGWLSKGREPDAEAIYANFSAAVAKAKADYLMLASRTLSKLAVGGLITLP